MSHSGKPTIPAIDPLRKKSPKYLASIILFVVLPLILSSAAVSIFQTTGSYLIVAGALVLGGFVFWVCSGAPDIDQNAVKPLLGIRINRQ